MPQTPALNYSGGNLVDYTPGTAVPAGTVVLFGGIPLIAPSDIAANAKGALDTDNIWKVPKTSDVFAAGDTVRWGPTSDPVGGMAGSGAGNLTLGAAMGVAAAAALTGDAYVYTKLVVIPKGTDAALRTQAAPVAETGTSQAYTAAELATGVITSTQTGAVTGTLDTGANLDTAFPAAGANDAFDWTLINLGSSSGAVTVTASTGHTIVGNAVVAISTSARFRTRKTAAATWVTYRVS